MSNLNRLTMIGNIGTEPEFKYFESGALLTKFTLAVNRYDKKEKKDVTDWFNVETFSKLAEYLKKGMKICVDGSLETNVWQNNEGKNIKNYIVRARTIEILTKKENTDTEGNKAQEQQTPQDDYAEADNEIPANTTTTGEQQSLIEDEEIPF